MRQILERIEKGNNNDESSEPRRTIEQTRHIIDLRKESNSLLKNIKGEDKTKLISGFKSANKSELRKLDSIIANGKSTPGQEIYYWETINAYLRDYLKTIKEI